MFLLQTVRLAEGVVIVPSLLGIVGTGLGLVAAGSWRFDAGWLIGTYASLALMAVLRSLLSVQAHRTALSQAEGASGAEVPPGARAPLLTPPYRVYRPLMLALTGWVVALMVFKPF